MIYTFSLIIAVLSCFHSDVFLNGSRAGGRPLFRKLRKNLGAKNCELAPEYITEIVQTYQKLAVIDRPGDDGLASKVFNNTDFGYIK